MLLVATRVMSSPARFTSATPNGMVYSSSGTGPLSWYIILSSKKTTGIVVADRALQQPLGIVGRRGQRDLQARDMADPGVQALASAARRTARRAQRGAQDHRHFELAAGHVVDLGRLVHHRSMVRVRKSPNMMSTTGRMPVMAAPTPMPVMPGLRDRRVDDALVPNSSTSPASTLNGVPASRHPRR